MVDVASMPRPRERVIVQETKDALVLLDLDRGTYFSLNDVGHRVWQMCDGTNTVEEIVAGIVAEFDAPADVVEADIKSLLAELFEEKLLVT